MKVVINKCFGGFGLSSAAQQAFAKRKGKCLTFYEQTKYSFQGGSDEYSRLDVPSASLFVVALTCDMGPTIKKLPEKSFWYPDIDRADPDLLAVVNELGVEAASGDCSKLEIVEIPDGTKYQIDEYDGQESIHEEHRSW